MNAPRFISLDASSIRPLASRFKDRDVRIVSDIHVHATHSPSIADYFALVEELDGRADLAGEELCRRLWRRHTRNQGWSHSGHHILIDPDGLVWLCRPWSLPPVSVGGHNGNAIAGPLCVSLIGDFEQDREVMTAAQRKAFVTAAAGLLAGFELDEKALRNPHDLGACKRGPGIELKDFVKDIGKHQKDSFSEKTGKRKTSPLGASEDRVEQLLRCLLEDPENTIMSSQGIESARGLEDDHDHDSVTFNSPETRGSGRARSGFALTPQLRSRLKRHVINLRQGEFSNTGDFCTTESDFESLVERSLADWIKLKKAEGQTPRLMIHAHGGLNNEEAGLEYAANLIDWWMQNGIYPIFFVWETGIVESVLQLVEEKLGRRGRGFFDELKSAAAEARDASVEAFMRQFGQDFWSIMKLSARRASEDSPASGAFQLANKLDSLVKKHPELECHAVGHSAGAIFHAYFLSICYEGSRKVPFDSLSLLAPACTVGLFRERLIDRVDGKRIKRLNLFNLDSATERKDRTVPIYGKSLLHLVSDGFEGRRDTPILGMERAINGDTDLARRLGLSASLEPDIVVVYSPSDTDAHASMRASATSHGGLSRDSDTLTSVARLILPAALASSVQAPPSLSTGARGGDERLFDSLSQRIDDDTYDALFRQSAEQSSISHRPWSSAVANRDIVRTTTQLPGRYKALCIGIDAYPGRDRLECCVSDALAWQESLTRLGFEAKTLLDADATYEGIMSSMKRVVGEANAGDIVAIQYSGHGIQFPDSNGDEEDAQDEALVPINSAHQLFISDDELWELLQDAAEGVQLYVFMDCCHSRSNSRAYARASEGSFGSARRARRIVANERMIIEHRRRLLPLRRGRGAQFKPINSMRHIKYSACHDKEEAFEENGQGNFSRAALKVLNGLRTGESNDSIRLAIEQNFLSDARQQPGLECPAHIKQQPFMGGIGLG